MNGAVLVGAENFYVCVAQAIEEHTLLRVRSRPELEEDRNNEPDSFVTGIVFRTAAPKPPKAPHAQQIELDLDVLSRERQGFADLRLVRGGKQVPYIMERTSISRALALTASSSNDPKQPRLSRWIIKLPLSGLPLTRAAWRHSGRIFLAVRSRSNCPAP